jgi:hypothetical protein
MMRNFLKLIFAFVLFLNSNSCRAYSVLTHEAIIDANWQNVLLPLLKQKFPAATAEELKTAHAYAYGGAVVPDMGYYPFGSKLFTRLIHYVRSGDFVEAIINEAQNLNEYAFALGVLCHYCADNYGHKLGVNISVPIIYPKVKKKFGDVVPYEKDHISHLRTEFGFDVLQTARGNYGSESYHDLIGFQVATTVLEKAFLKTYGLDVNDLFGDFSRTVASFRWIVKSFMPTITRAAWSTRSDEIRKTLPNATGRSFIYRMHRKNYVHEFGNEKPRFMAKLLSTLITVLPKIGPLRVLKFTVPDADAEKFFIKSFDTTSLRYSTYLSQLYNKPINLGNINFDTGKKTVPGEYRLTDKSYEEWLLKLQNKNFETTSDAAKQNILNFYGDDGTVNVTDQKLRQALEKLKTAGVHQ